MKAKKRKRVRPRGGPCCETHAIQYARTISTGTSVDYEDCTEDGDVEMSNFRDFSNPHLVSGREFAKYYTRITVVP